jgi:hypothetical protein
VSHRSHEARRLAQSVLRIDDGNFTVTPGERAVPSVDDEAQATLPTEASEPL